MKCQKCGTLAMPEDRFCGACGTRLEQVSEEQGNNFISSAAATQASLNAAFLHYRLGLVYYKQGKLREAIQSWERTVELDPDHQDAHRMLNRAHLELQIAGGE